MWSANCLQGVIFISLFCFLLGLVIQVLFHLVPPSQALGLRAQPHNAFLLDGQLVDVTEADIRAIFAGSAGSAGSIGEARDIGSVGGAGGKGAGGIRGALGNTAISPPISRPVVRIPARDTVPGTFALSDSGIDSVPAIVTAWRAARLDWHALLPGHASLWQRFGQPKGEGKLPLLVQKETLVTDYLTRFKESGLAASCGLEHGPLGAYSGCNVLQSSCMVHTATACAADHLCALSSARNLCVDFNSLGEEAGATAAEAAARACPNPRVMGEKGFDPVKGDPANVCKTYVRQPAVVVSLDSESQSMFYHWWASWTGIVAKWQSELGGRRDIHFFIREINDAMFFPFFGFLSDNCWRRVGAATNPPGACFCDTREWHGSQARTNADFASKQMLSFLGVDKIKPPTGVKVGIISRRRKRFILNEYELVRAVQAMGHECVLLPLEAMTLYEQMAALRSLDVLVGIHGSGLDNSVFLHKGAVLVQLLPYSVEHKCTFRASAERAGVHYMEWTLKDRLSAVFHWDLLLQANANALQHTTHERLLDRGQRGADSRETLMFWINQDIVVPLDQWGVLVNQAVAKARPSG